MWSERYGRFWSKEACRDNVPVVLLDIPEPTVEVEKQPIVVEEAVAFEN